MTKFGKDQKEGIEDNVRKPIVDSHQPADHSSDLHHSSPKKCCDTIFFRNNFSKLSLFIPISYELYVALIVILKLPRFLALKCDFNPKIELL